MNTIVVLMDTLRRDHLGCYGHSPVKTPNIDRFASQSCVFDNSFIGSYPCMPARQDLFTGQLNFLRRGWAPLEYDQPDLITLLGEAGLRTAMMTDHYHYWQYGSGNYLQGFHSLEMVRGQENDNYKSGSMDDVTYPAREDAMNKRWFQYFFNTKKRADERDYFSAQVFDKSIGWLQDNAGQEDFFLMLDCFDPHEPFDPPFHYAEPYLPKGWEELLSWPQYGDSARFTQLELEVIHALYCGEIAFLDAQFGRMLEALEALGLQENTAIILTSDHGWLFGEHNWLGKHSRILYNDISRTPLIVHHPALRAGRSDVLVQTADLMPTILDIHGLERPHTVQSESLACLWDTGLPAAILRREGLLYGVFGGETYCTDGEHVFVKAPGKDNYPLYWYTRSHFHNWDFGQVNYWQDNVKRIEQFDGERFPVQYPGANPTHAAPLYAAGEDLRTTVENKRDELYSLPDDPGQSRNLAEQCPERADHYRRLMCRLMERYNAPPEQYQRLTL